jgi:hypothetical protein
MILELEHKHRWKFVRKSTEFNPDTGYETEVFYECSCGNKKSTVRRGRY